MNKSPHLYLLISILGTSWMCCGTVSWMYYAAANNQHLVITTGGAAFFLVSGLSVTFWYLSKGVKTMSIFNKKGSSSTLQSDRVIKQTVQSANPRSTPIKQRRNTPRIVHQGRTKTGDIQVGGESYTVDEYDWYFGPDDDDL